MAASQATEPDFDEDSPTQFGCVLFDNDKEMQDGWASVAGDSPFRISSISKLPSDCIWVTNGDWKEFTFQGHKNVHNLRRNNYFRTALRGIAGDLGCIIEIGESWKLCQTLSHIFSAASQVSDAAYEIRKGGGFTADTLSDEIKRSLPQAAATPTEMAQPLLSAFQRDSADASVRWMQGCVMVTLRPNRVTYAKRMLESRFPEGSWEIIRDGELPVGDMKRIDHVLNFNRPVLAQVQVDTSSSEGSLAGLAAFGSQFGRRSSLRLWVSDVELAWLSEVCNVSIREVMVCERYKTLKGLPTFFDDPLVSLSYAAGLVAESHWSCVASTNYMPSLKTHEASARAVWVRAMDRALSFKLARRAHESGFTVRWYGDGAVMVRIVKEELGKLMAFALENDCYAPNFQMLAESLNIQRGVHFD